ncbi:HsdM family class I SAM-dependent methyltransferase [Bacillus pumilus]
MLLTEPELNWLDDKGNKSDLLGQVFTPEDVAELMVSMALESNPKTILDPCFGEGVFLKVLNRKIKDASIKNIGIEIDPELYKGIREKLSSFNLYNGDFFDFDKEVECIIMNPPYIRQELLKKEMPKFLNKKEILKRLPLTNTNISSRSNLYIYFFIKSWALLKNHGEIVAIVPNTWMTAEYGQTFKDFLLSNFWIKSIIQFSKDVFPNADVDSCIIHLQKDIRNIEKHSNMVNINQAMSKKELVCINQLIYNEDKKLSINKVMNKSLHLEKNWFDFFTKKTLFNLENKMVTLDQLADLKRGTTTNYNDFFIKNHFRLVEKYPNYFIDIICSPKDIEGYTTKSLIRKNYLLSTIEKKKQLPLELNEYVEKYEDEVLKDSKPKTLYNKIIKKPDQWFNIKNLTSAPIIFSYIVRDRKKFILNEASLVARDNFYEISPKEQVDKLILFSILNSRITSLFLEDIGRSHGKGLLKIQKYELEKLKIVNPNTISKHDLVLLAKLGEGLTKSLDQNALQYISKIDKILLPYVSTKLNVEDLEELLRIKLDFRLNRKSGHLKLVSE